MTNEAESQLTDVVERLNIAAACLPLRDRSAKLRGLIKRLEWTIANRADTNRPVVALIRAAWQALEDDPWFQVYRIAHELEHKPESDAEGNGGATSAPISVAELARPERRSSPCGRTGMPLALTPTSTEVPP